MKSEKAFLPSPQCGSKMSLTSYLMARNKLQGGHRKKSPGSPLPQAATFPLPTHFPLFSFRHLAILSAQTLLIKPIC